MICHLHYCTTPCDQCAVEAFLRRVAPREARPSEPLVAAPAVITFRPAVFEHMYHPWETPRVIDTPADLLAETAARGVTSEYLRDSLLWRSRPPREI